MLQVVPDADHTNSNPQTRTGNWFVGIFTCKKANLLQIMQLNGAHQLQRALRPEPASSQ